jgi:hypothetical protein
VRSHFGCKQVLQRCLASRPLLVHLRMPPNIASDAAAGPGAEKTKLRCQSVGANYSAPSADSLAPGVGVSGWRGTCILEAPRQVYSRRIGDQACGLDRGTPTSRCLRSWSTENTDVRRVGGLTLRDKLRTDKVAARTSGTAMGGPYYSHLKTLYSTDSQITEALTPKKKDEPINDQLMRSMVVAKRAVADRSEMQKYMARRRRLQIKGRRAACSNV